MNISFSNQKKSLRRGLTLMEAVIALGVIAFAVPLIVAATSQSSKTRISAEADTRSAWLAQDVQRQLIDSWNDRVTITFPTKPMFPDFGTASSPIVLLYDNDSAFVQTGTPQEYTNGSTNQRASYLVSVYGIGTTPHNLTTTERNLSRVIISVENSAKAMATKRNRNVFTLLIPRQTSP
jgi:type II secretory pathway pseudopilin PulG